MSTNTNPATPPLVRFYDPSIQAADANGRTLSSILALPDSELEYCHDYIQLLFPLPETSAFHPSAPIIDAAIFHAFRSRPDLQSQLKLSLTRMLHFYGFLLSSTSKDEFITPGPHFPHASRNWLKRFNHNHLRITRIIRSLRVLGLESHALLFHQALVSVYDNGRSGIGAKSMMFWTRAAERPLYLAPEDERDEGKGKGFLYEFEAGRGDQANGVGGAERREGKGGENLGEEGAEA